AHRYETEGGTGANFQTKDLNTHGLREEENSRTSAPTSFLELFVNRVPFEYPLKKYKIRKTQHEPLAYEIDDGHKFRNTVSFTKNNQTNLQTIGNGKSSSMRNILKKRKQDAEVIKEFSKLAPKEKVDRQQCPISTIEWEENVEQWDGSAADVENHPMDENSIYEPVQMVEYVNSLLSTNWEKNIFYDKKTKINEHITLYIDDPNLIFEKIEEKKNRKKSRKSYLDQTSKNKYNISNDKYYQNEGRKASLGSFGVQHSVPALRLEDKYYRINIAKEDLGLIRRPALALATKEYPFSASKTPQLDTREVQQNQNPVKTKHPKRIDEYATENTGQYLRKASEITLADSSQFFLVEYIEESPLFIIKPGMVSLFNKYYRKIDTGDDAQCPDAIVLENEEADPFFGFGKIKPGTVQQVITNNLYSAPVVEHQTNLFLCIAANETLVCRPAKSIFLAGQQFPKEEVFAPHSRKLNQFCKDRLKVAAHRAFGKGRPLLMSELDRAFPYFSEGSKRKWLKEYADCVKRGRDNVWVLKETYPILGEEDIRKLITPENIVQYESMLIEEKKMQSLGFRCVESEEDERDDRYAPSWVLSRNFVNAVSGRGLLEITSRNEDTKSSVAEGNKSYDACTMLFNYRKIKLKKGNEAENRKIMSEHQATYKERIGCVWKNQINFISQTKPSYAKTAKSNEKAPENTDGKRTLRIKRTYTDDGGSTTVKYETLGDELLIKAYLKAKKKGNEKKSSLVCSNCGQAGHMKTNKSCPKYANNFVGSTKRVENDKKRARIYLQDAMNKLLSSFVAIPFSSAFHRPVSAKKFPKYALIVKNPIDFSAIRANIRNGNYKSFLAFSDAFKLMRDNCILYNGENHSLTEIAKTIVKKLDDFYAEHAEQLTSAEQMLNDTSENKNDGE
ncbi:transcription initiation factor TFIID subunit 1, partial [Enteropsectra breve]